MASGSVIVHPASRVTGHLRVPGDKSIAHRYAILAALRRSFTAATLDEKLNKIFKTMNPQGVAA